MTNNFITNNRGIEARSRNHRCRGKAISITHFSVCVCVCVCVRAIVSAYMCMLACVCVCVGARAQACAHARVVLLIQHSLRCHIVICALSGSSISLRARFSGKSYRERNVYFDFYLQLAFKIFLILIRRPCAHHKSRHGWS